MKFRDLEKVRLMILETTGLEVAYAYDDLVFPEHAAFLIQFDDSDESHFFYLFHKDCNEIEKSAIAKKLQNYCKENYLKISDKGIFSMEQKGEEILLTFN